MNTSHAESLFAAASKRPTSERDIAKKFSRKYSVRCDDVNAKAQRRKVNSACSFPITKQ